MKNRNVEEWEKAMLAKPIASSVSGEHELHKVGEEGFEYGSILPDHCVCDRCKIISIKRRRAYKMPRSKCKNCGHLQYLSVINRPCEKCGYYQG